MKISLIGHEYTYEAYQVASLFYEKSDIEFTDDGEYLSIYEKGKCIFKSKDENIYFEEVVEDNKKQIKLGLKITILKGLKKVTGKEIPWGVLVGIRPTKLYHEFKVENLSDLEIKNLLISKYCLSEEKANLLIEVAKAEEEFLKSNSKEISVYIGIPFCPTRCVYCSFTSNAITKNNLVEEYLTSLIKEIDYTFKLIKEKGLKIDTLYIGGGTPTSLNEKQFETLLKTVYEKTKTDNIREYTVEAGRPDSITEEKLKCIKKYGATRISINPQTMNNETLKKIGRLHSAEDINETFYLARELGFDNINMDVIIGLPGENEEHVKTTMEGIKKLNPDSITIHTMAIKRASRLHEIGYSVEDNRIINMYNIANNYCREMGMNPYYMYRQKNMVSPLENIGYSYKGNESIYNVQMIGESISIVGLGADSVSKAVFKKENRIERVANLKDVREYNSRINEILQNKEKALNMIEESFK